MNVTEANATNLLLRYLLNVDGPAGPVGSEQACQAAELLAGRAHKVLAAGYTAERVRADWSGRSEPTGRHTTTSA